MEAKTNFEWFAIQTRTRLEQMAAHTLATLGLETLLPLARIRGRPDRDRERCVRPLFRSYCFARFRPCVDLHRVRYSRGVVRVVGTEETPWPVDESIIEEIRDRLDENGLVELEWQRLRRGDCVRVCDGPLEGWNGVFDGELDDRSRVVVLLHTIQQARVIIERKSLERVESN